MVALVLVAIPLGTLLAIKSDAYSRVDVSLKAFQGDHQSLNEATSGRMDIWGTSLRMIADNPVNGVGVRGYRHAYPDYALAGDPFSTRSKTPGLFHQLLLDVTREPTDWPGGLIVFMQSIKSTE
jgi:O-antigen ligase